MAGGAAATPAKADSVPAAEAAAEGEGAGLETAAAAAGETGEATAGEEMADEVVDKETGEKELARAAAMGRWLFVHRTGA